MDSGQRHRVTRAERISRDAFAESFAIDSFAGFSWILASCRVERVFLTSSGKREGG